MTDVRLLPPDGAPGGRHRVPVRLPRGGTVLLEVRRTSRARYLRLKVNPAREVPELVVPERTPPARARAFLDGNLDWLAGRLARLPAPRPFCPGGVIPVRGEAVTIRMTGENRGAARLAEDVLLVPGSPAACAQRVMALLGELCRAELLPVTATLARRIGMPPPALRVSDPAGCWGRCSRSGIMLSWRLVLAPPAIAFYVAAHEVAHLREMNHGEAFWKLVASLAPDYLRARDWLRRNGALLHACGRTSGPASVLPIPAVT